MTVSPMVLIFFIFIYLFNLYDFKALIFIIFLINYAKRPTNPTLGDNFITFGLFGLNLYENFC